MRRLTSRLPSKGNVQMGTVGTQCEDDRRLSCLQTTLRLLMRGYAQLLVTSNKHIHDFYLGGGRTGKAK